MRHYYKESALDLKQKEVIAVGAAGATRQEIIDAAAIGD